MGIRYQLGVLILVLMRAGSGLAAGTLQAAPNLPSPKKSVLAPFVSDGCSVPVGFGAKKYESCCTHHDYSYWVGGALEDKNRADATLINCIRSHGASEFTAGAWQSMLANFGAFRWGSKWQPRRANVPLNENEREQVKKLAAIAALEIPQVRSVWAMKACPEPVVIAVRNGTRLHETHAVTCYPLINNDSHDDRRSFMIFSDGCEGGYFIYRSGSTKSGFASAESLGGFGMCVDRLAPPLQAQVDTSRNIHVLDRISQ